MPSPVVLADATRARVVNLATLHALTTASAPSPPPSDPSACHSPRPPCPRAATPFSVTTHVGRPVDTRRPAFTLESWEQHEGVAAATPSLSTDF